MNMNYYMYKSRAIVELCYFDYRTV